MTGRLLGDTGMRVSEIAFGGVEIGMPYGIGVHSRSDMLPDHAAVDLLHEALDAGVNFFDTARLYGGSEVLMGKAFYDRRARVIICTKCRHFRKEDGSLPGHADLRRIIESSLHESLQALQTDYVDVFMLHQADLGILEDENIGRVFNELKKSGKIRSTGASVYSTAETKKAIESGNWNVIQLPFNLMDQRHATLFADAYENGIGIVVRSVLLKGLLSEKRKNLHPALQEVEAHINKFDELTGGSAPDLPTLATRFALTYQEVSSVLVGIDRSEYLQKALLAGNGKYLNKEEFQLAQRLKYPSPEFLDLPEWDRLGWLK